MKWIRFDDLDEEAMEAYVDKLADQLYEYHLKHKNKSQQEEQSPDSAAGWCLGVKAFRYLGG